MATHPHISFGFPAHSSLLITGAGSGIGRATAVAAANMGLNVSLWDLDAAALAKTVSLLSHTTVEIHSWAADVSDNEKISQGLDHATKQLGPIPLLFNNAGPPSSADLDFDEALRISIGSVKALTEAWARSHPGRDAAMVLTSSVAGNLIGTDSDWYSTSKAALAGYVRHLAAYRAQEFRSNAIAPGMTDTPRLAGFSSSEIGQRVLQRIPLGRMGSPENIAFAALFLLSPIASYINGVYLPIDGGWTITQ